MYDQVINELRQSYDRNAQERDAFGIDAWKVEERGHFLDLIQKENKKNLLEIGAGPGRDSKFFQDKGLDVTCTDLSPEMVELCRSKGLNAYAMDFQNLNFEDHSFDAIYGLNCLLHVPKRDLKSVLAKIQKLLKPDGFFYVGVYGGYDFEGIWQEDEYIPKRFFSFHTDESIKQAVSDFFEILYFKNIDLDAGDEAKNRQFQSIILKPML